MKLLLIKCGICDYWHRANNHCRSCGAYHVRFGGRTTHYNRHGVVMVRGYIETHNVIQRAISRMSSEVVSNGQAITKTS